MRITRWLGIVVVAVLFCPSLENAHAQGFGVWSGKWFKLTFTESGSHIGTGGSFTSVWEREKYYLRIDEVDETNRVLRCNFYDAGWEPTGPLNIHIMGNNPLDFLFWSQTEMVTSLGRTFAGFTGRFRGKVKGEEVTSGSMETIGGYAWEDLVYGVYTEFTATRLTMTGRMVDEGKLPFDSE